MLAPPLIRFGALISAHEIVDVLPGLVSSVQHIADAERSAVCALALDAAIELAAPTFRARDAVLRLVSAAGFPDAVAAPALIALARSDPAALPKHLDYLWRPLNEQYGPVVVESDDDWRVEERDELLLAIASVAPIECIARAFRPAERKVETSDWYFYDWFCSGIMTSEHPAVRELAEEILHIERCYFSGTDLLPPDISRSGGDTSPKGVFFRPTQVDELELEEVVEATMGPPDPRFEIGEAA